MSIASEIQRLQTAKADIKTALESKGITVPSSLKIDGYAQLIESIVPDTRVVAKFNVTNTSNNIKICNGSSVSQFSALEIDGVAQSSVVYYYQFSTTGEHTVKYTLIDPTSIGNNTFYNCSDFTSVTIPNTVTSIGNYVFSYCNRLTAVIIPNSVTSIGNYAFDGIPWWNTYSADTSHHYGNMIYINDVAYKAANTSITSATFKSGTVCISGGAFRSCSSLTSIEIPSGVTSIGNMAFQGCSGLTSIISNAVTAPTIGSDTFQSVNTGGTLTVPSGSSGYDVWMQNANYYLGLYEWTKVEQ